MWEAGGGDLTSGQTDLLPFIPVTDAPLSRADGRGVTLGIG